MKTLKKYGKTLGIFFLFLFFFSFSLTLLSTLFPLESKTIHILILIGMIITLFFIGFTWGKKAEKKGYLEGIKISFSLIFFLILINVLFYQTGFSLERCIYYLVLILSSMLGSIIGINKKS